VYLALRAGDVSARGGGLAYVLDTEVTMTAYETARTGSCLLVLASLLGGAGCAMGGAELDLVSPIPDDPITSLEADEGAQALARSALGAEPIPS